jgi:hypothetical protein
VVAGVTDGGGAEEPRSAKQKQITHYLY